MTWRSQEDGPAQHTPPDLSLPPAWPQCHPKQGLFQEGTGGSGTRGSQEQMRRSDRAARAGWGPLLKLLGEAVWSPWKPDTRAQTLEISCAELCGLTQLPRTETQHRPCKGLYQGTVPPTQAPVKPTEAALQDEELEVTPGPGPGLTAPQSWPRAPAPWSLSATPSQRTPVSGAGGEGGLGKDAVTVSSAHLPAEASQRSWECQNCF
nr:uncharacterized protein LOC110129586 [Odocoileus virginianus texanus]